MLCLLSLGSGYTLLEQGLLLVWVWEASWAPAFPACLGRKKRTWISLNTAHQQVHCLCFFVAFILCEAHFGLDLHFHSSYLGWKVNLREWTKLLERKTENAVISFHWDTIRCQRKKLSKNWEHPKVGSSWLSGSVWSPCVPTSLSVYLAPTTMPCTCFVVFHLDCRGLCVLRLPKPVMSLGSAGLLDHLWNLAVNPGTQKRGMESPASCGPHAIFWLLSFASVCHYLTTDST